MSDLIKEAIKEINHSYATIVDGELVYQRNAMLNMFCKGAEWQAKQSPWISVKDRLPEIGDPCLIRLKDGTVRLTVLDIDDNSDVYFWSDNYSYETISGWDVTHWCPIPSFDEILEANKDVLERIKEKEVSHG
jgi:hypothetical protein